MWLVLLLFSLQNLFLCSMDNGPREVVPFLENGGNIKAALVDGTDANSTISTIDLGTPTSDELEIKFFKEHKKTEMIFAREEMISARKEYLKRSCLLGTFVCSSLVGIGSIVTIISVKNGEQPSNLFYSLFGASVVASLCLSSFSYAYLKSLYRDKDPYDFNEITDLEDMKINYNGEL